ncbi:MAG: DUF4123 domain-containing protein [Pseudomonadota bacterium]
MTEIVNLPSGDTENGFKKMTVTPEFHAERNGSKVLKELWSFTGQQSASKLYAILDGARDDRIYHALASCDCEYLCLYKGRLPLVLAEAAPYLVELKPQSRFAEWLVNTGWGNSWGIFFTARKDLFDVVSHFRQFILVEDEERNTLYFRFYDPRVMRVYLLTCNSEELKTVFGPVRHIIMEKMRKEKGVVFLLEKGDLLAQEIECG